MRKYTERDLDILVRDALAGKLSDPTVVTLAAHFSEQTPETREIIGGMAVKLANILPRTSPLGALEIIHAIGYFYGNSITKKQRLHSEI